MQTCQNNGWDHVVVLKDDNLKILQQDIADTDNKHRHGKECCNITAKGKTHTKQQYDWISVPF